MLERLQKILSARGICSRRTAEDYLERGLVLVNGKVATLGQKADPDADHIEVKGEVLEARRDMLYYLFCKPAGVITSNVDREEKSPQHSAEPMEGFEATKTALERLKKREAMRAPESTAETVRDLLPKELQGKVYPVGRLDKDSEGLLLLTNDGVLAYRLTHPKFDHEKEYEVVVKDPIKDGALRKLAEGVTIDDALTKPARIRRLDEKTFRITLTEGRNRQIRRMCSKVGSEVVRLTRVRIANIDDASLKPGSVRPLNHVEREELLRAVGAADTTRN